MIAANGGVARPIVRLLSLYSETSLHPGTGSSTGIIDLPVQRERHTGFPIMPASGLKGSLRQLARESWPGDARITALFGPDVGTQDGLFAGAIAFGEARLIAFPVRSTSQVFVWVTCPLVLDRLRQDLSLVGLAEPLPAFADEPKNAGEAKAPTNSGLSSPLVLEDLSFDRQNSDDTKKVAGWIAEHLMSAGAHAEVNKKMRNHLLVVTDETYEHFVRTATQVSARIKLNERKTTTGDGGNLWYEETLPRDCLFTAVVRFEKPRGGASGLGDPQAVDGALTDLLKDHSQVQFGGNETVGEGWCTVRAVE